MNAEPDVTLPALDHKESYCHFLFCMQAPSDRHILNGKVFYFSTRLPLHTDPIVSEAFWPRQATKSDSIQN